MVLYHSDSFHRSLYFFCTGSSCSVSDTNSDFTGISRFLQFVNAQQSQSILVPITDDNVTEGVEELTVSLSLQDMELATSVNVTPAVATVRILDNDSKSLAYLPKPVQSNPILCLWDQNLSEGQSSPMVMVYRIACAGVHQPGILVNSHPLDDYCFVLCATCCITGNFIHTSCQCPWEVETPFTVA